MPNVLSLSNMYRIGPTAVGIVAVRLNALHAVAFGACFSIEMGDQFPARFSRSS